MDILAFPTLFRLDHIYTCSTSTAIIIFHKFNSYLAALSYIFFFILMLTEREEDSLPKAAVSGSQQSSLERYILWNTLLEYMIQTLTKNLTVKF